MKKIITLLIFIIILYSCGGASKTTSREALKDDNEYKIEITKYPKEDSIERKKSKVTLAEKDFEKPKTITKGSFIEEPPIKERKSEKPIPSEPSESGLKAGYSDDNKQFNYFINFLEKYKNQVESYYPINVKERIIIKVIDDNKKPINNAIVSIYNTENKKIEEGKTLSDGSYMLFPSEYDNKYKEFKVRIDYQNQKKEITISREGKRINEVVIIDKRETSSEIPLDIVFVLDTTGSMGEEIERLKTTIEIINLNITSFKPKPRVRFGMVLYKDRGDEYVTRIIPLTESLDEFKKELDMVTAEGGGDTPEDLQEALKDLINSMKWNNKGIKLGFIITDAPPHLDYKDQKYTYVNAVKDAKKMGIKIFSVGTGGLDITGEYILRQISQYTLGKYIFLTYGERKESEGGVQGAVSHHTGENFTTDKLESIIIGLVKEELSNLVEGKIETRDEYFFASQKPELEKDKILKELFDKAINQLIDYSSIKIEEGTPTGIINLTTSENDIKKQAEYFTEQIAVSLSKNKTFKIVERKDLQKILGELELQSSDLFDEEKSAKLGKFLGAKILLIGKLYSKKENYEIFLKEVRVETAEVLSITKIIIDKNLGL